MLATLPNSAGTLPRSLPLFESLQLVKNFLLSILSFLFSSVPVLLIFFLISFYLFNLPSSIITLSSVSFLLSITYCAAVWSATDVCTGFVLRCVWPLIYVALSVALPAARTLYCRCNLSAALCAGFQAVGCSRRCLYQPGGHFVKDAWRSRVLRHRSL